MLATVTAMAMFIVYPAYCKGLFVAYVCRRYANCLGIKLSALSETQSNVYLVDVPMRTCLYWRAVGPIWGE